MNSFIYEVSNNMNRLDYNSNENILDCIWKEYESVILQSLITSFGLDFLVHDQYGGDVDTIHNVRKIGTDTKMQYKNANNMTDYENRGAYDSSAYHSDNRYIEINRKISEKKKNGFLKDSYTGKKLSPTAKVDLDHVVSSKEIHDDRGRILADLSGFDLANNEDNLKPTDRSINRSMKADDMEEYLANWEDKKTTRKARIAELKGKENLTDKEKGELNKLENIDQISPKKMREENQKARTIYNSKIQQSYYTSPKFLKDAVTAAGNRGAEMGMRQAIGFVFVEIYFSAKNELNRVPSNSSLEDMLKAAGVGIKKGAENAKSNYHDILSKFGEGFISGALASITTTICNIFYTTAKSLVRNIRQIYASVVQAGKVLLFNPDNLMFGDRLKTSAVILATGASILAGTAVGELIGKTPIGSIPNVGQTVQTFSSTLVSGLLSCTLLIFLDRSKFINNVIDNLNSIPTEANNYKEIADAMELMAIKLEKLDIIKFKEDTEKYENIAFEISNLKNEDEINSLLLTAYKELEIQIPWKGDFDDFMGKKENRLVFE